jgi:hypothetical protein
MHPEVKKKYRIFNGFWFKRCVIKAPFLEDNLWILVYQRTLSKSILIVLLRYVGRVMSMKAPRTTLNHQ